MKIFIILSLISFITFAQESREIRPSDKKSKIIINVSDEEREYYQLSEDKALILNVRGPGKIKMYSRAEITSKGQKEISYSIRYRINGNGVTEVKLINSRRSHNAKFKKSGEGVPANAELTEIRIPAGDNTLEFWGSRTRTAVRIIFNPSKTKKLKWISYAPAEPNEPVNLVSGEKITNYYRFSESRPLKINVNGPSKLRLFTRVENHVGMKGRILYRIRVKEDNIIRNTYQLNSLRSESTIYQHNDKMVPGRAKEIIIDVPEGNHTYEIIPLDKDKGTVLGRVLFPKKDI